MDVNSGMKFLLAIGSKEYSGPTLNIGIRIAKAFNAQLCIVYVGDKPKELYAGRVNLALDSMAKWQLYHPGIDVLEWAFHYLVKSGYLESSEKNGFNPENIVQDGDRFRMVLHGSYGEKVDLVLREGEIINELKNECETDDYNLTIIGGSKKRRMAHDLLQYLPSSILVVKNMDPKKKYKLLLCVDDSGNTRSAVRFGAEIAKNQNMFVDILTVSKTKKFGQDYKRAANSAGRYLKTQKIKYEQHFVTGDPVNSFIEYAGDDHILVMGASRQAPLKIFFLGSKPIKTLRKINLPVLVVR